MPIEEEERYVTENTPALFRHRQNLNFYSKCCSTTVGRNFVRQF